MKNNEHKKRRQLLDELDHLKHLLMSHPDVNDLPLLTDRIEETDNPEEKDTPLTTQQATWAAQLTETILDDCLPHIRRAVYQRLTQAIRELDKDADTADEP